ncbi:HlyD family secretion protein [Thalassomonas actiniarum]|uniref:HlyD family efflux transporter periplasmic adaptor subunit n=1 Tax=Thalassomonas actiniarum TaxID=485447 RepID=A0AAE9YT83_9GAMM|nr:HlyD family efflux transporter periplasmic adaptor subunit [Thalassomonas actiniarum]WDD99176.1 HlyD family efflux transporter periplasmic adaptor subunit [Thalassomonas actiniarum]
MSDLFRKEAIKHQGQKLDGDVTLATHMSFNVIAVLIVIIVAVGFTYLLLGEYHRKEAVSGYLRPNTGLSKIYPVAPGTIDEMYVEEGDLVEKGQLLARLRMDRHLSSGKEYNNSIIEELLTQKNLIGANVSSQQQLFEVDLQNNKVQMENSKAKLLQTQNQQKLLKERLELGKKKLDDTASLIKSGFVSQREYQDQQDAYLALKQQVEDIQAQVLSQKQELSQYRFQAKQMPIEHKEQIGQLKSQLAGINQEISQADAQRSLDIRSNRRGTVTNLLVNVGMMAQSNYPLMTILPEEAKLEAVLYVPTRAYGFVKEGQKTRIRYQAFPYQRFGIYQGKIEKVSKSVLLPNEANLPVSLQEPVYQVVVDIEQQEAIAYGLEVPLQAGMLLEADIMVDSRSLFEWLFEPIYSIKGDI